MDLPSNIIHIQSLLIQKMAVDGGTFEFALSTLRHLSQFRSVLNPDEELPAFSLVKSSIRLNSHL